jgi:hypothetical protein
MDTGVPHDTLYQMSKRGSVPGGARLAALCKWSGLNCADYLIDLEDLK